MIKNVRIIGGKYRGRLLFHSATGVRPTADRVKEDIFNLLQYHHRKNMVGGVVLDLFAGSGALAIESLSRGANHAVFIDNNKHALADVQKNLIGFSKEAYRLIHADATLVNLVNLNLKFTLVFIDPPYASDLVRQSLTNLLEQKICSEKCIFIIESPLDLKIDSLKLILEKPIGKIRIGIYSL